MKNFSITNDELTQTKNILATELAKYIQIIKTEYKNIIPTTILKYLDSIQDLKTIIKIEQTGTISLFVNNGFIYLPINAYEILNIMKNIPGFGINKKHKLYTSQTIITNNNTYQDYIKHVFIAGLTPLEFFLETLLHETTHLCGIGGANALREGFAELKTRELAAKYNITISSCGYPKEVAIAISLQNLWGKEICDRIAFAENDKEIYRLLTSSLDENAANFYTRISNEMSQIFQPYYEKTYPGITGPLKKVQEYNKIDYNSIYELINEQLSNKPVNSNI